MQIFIGLLFKMFIIQKIIQKVKFLISSKIGIFIVQFCAISIFIIALFIIGKESTSDNNEHISLVPDQTNIHKIKPLQPLLSNDKLNNKLITDVDIDKYSLKQIELDNNFSKNDLQIFQFDANAQMRNPINHLVDLIKRTYPTQTLLLDITQEINASIFQTFEQLAIKNQDILFTENAVRLNTKGEPYPFITLELSKKNSTQKYFQSQKEIDIFVSTLSKNLKKRNFSQTRVKLINEKQFLYITFNNIISHIIRLEPRKERMNSFNPLKSDKFYFTLIIDDVGENFTIARKMMDLPFPVILSIWPQSTHGTSIATLAHEKGLPVFLHQPMEPKPNKNSTPRMGLNGLKTNMSQKEITQILQRNMLSVPHTRGINNHMGSKFTTTPKAIETLLRALKDIMPHILILDSLTHNDSLLYSSAKQYGFLTGERNYFIDNNNTNSNITQMLTKAYNFAKNNGHAYVIGHARQKALQALLAWNLYKDTNIVFALPSH